MRRALRPMVHRLRRRRDALLGGNCLVLLYHRVADLETDPQLLAVSPQRFDEQLDWLKQACRMLTVEEFDDLLASGRRFPRNSALITFDDGYADNHLHARPILEKHGIQGLFFVSSGYIGSSIEYWWDELERLLLVNPAVPEAFHWERHGLSLQWTGAPSKDQLQEAYERALRSFRTIPSPARDAALEELRALLNSAKPRATHLAMRIDELQAFAASPSVRIGAHTVGHPSLAHLDEEEQRLELRGSRTRLEAWLGSPINRLAYPFGTGADFSPATMRIAQEEGFVHAAANLPGIVHKGSPRFSYPRILVRDWRSSELAHALKPYLH